MPPEITLSLLAWLFKWSTVIIALVIGIIALSGRLFFSGKLAMRRKVTRLADARRGGSFSTFAADFPPGQAEPDVLRAVYDGFQRAVASHQGVEGFVVRADDHLEAVYDAHLINEDYNDFYDCDLRALVLEVAKACDRCMPPEVEASVRVKLRTVRDVVALIQRWPRIQESG